MKFGVREICDVVFKALQEGDMGSMHYVKGQPVLFIDSAKTSTIEGAATTVYAQGGRGNSRLIAWEGEKTLTFTVEDALLSEVGFAILSGAGLFEHASGSKSMVHCTEIAYVSENKLTLDHAADVNAPVFIMEYANGSIGRKITNASVTDKIIDLSQAKVVTTEKDDKGDYKEVAIPATVKTYFVDYYYANDQVVTELQIDAENFAGYYYVEASTLFRRESDGKDLPAEIAFPKVKIQSNFTFNMASTGDPSTFTFTMDAMPAYTMFEKTKKVLCAMQVIDDTNAAVERKAVTTLTGSEKADLEGYGILDNDSVSSSNN